LFGIANEESDIKDGVNRAEFTRRETLKAMNSINDDVSFTMELSTDFEDCIHFHLHYAKGKIP